MKHLIEKEKIDKVATQHKFTCIDYQVNIGMVSYSNGNTRLNIYLTTMTVATCLDHPKKGKTQLFRKNVTLDQLAALFKNPRKHTGKGYYKKASIWK